MNEIVKGHIIFDHDGTLVKVQSGGISLFSGMKDLLIQLKKENYELYIWTARGRSSTIMSLKSLDVAHFFNELYCYDDGIPKPHPIGLQKLTNGIEKKNILHIGDSFSDYEGAKNFDIDFVFAGWNQPDQANSLRDIMPAIATNLTELKKLIDKKFEE
jgi:phosphoglycolate phosphatase-like HAD superfamily hydrolase